MPKSVGGPEVSGAVSVPRLLRNPIRPVLHPLVVMGIEHVHGRYPFRVDSRPLEHRFGSKANAGDRLQGRWAIDVGLSGRPGYL